MQRGTRQSLPTATVMKEVKMNAKDLVECKECCKVSQKSKLKHEFDLEYDQKLCPKCGDVLINCITGEEYFEAMGYICYDCKHLKNVGVMFGDEWKCLKECAGDVPEVEDCNNWEELI